MAADSGEQEGVVMILAAEEILIVGHLARETHFVTGGTKFRRLVKGFQEGLLMKSWLGLHQLLVEIEPKGIGRSRSPRVMHRFLNDVVSVALGGMDVNDGMA
jgi:hypothetical protein